jgi:hypothetical protein
MTVEDFAGRLAAVAAYIAFLAGLSWLGGTPSDPDREDFGARYGMMMARSGRVIFYVAGVISMIAFIVWLVAPSG